MPGSEIEKDAATVVPERESADKKKMIADGVVPVTDEAPIKATTPATVKDGAESTPASAVATSKAVSPPTATKL